MRAMIGGLESLFDRSTVRQYITMTHAGAGTGSPTFNIYNNIPAPAADSAAIDATPHTDRRRAASQLRHRLAETPTRAPSWQWSATRGGKLGRLVCRSCSRRRWATPTKTPLHFLHG